MTEHLSTERVYFNPPSGAQQDESWWAHYIAELANLTPTARAALEVDSRYIVERGVFGEGPPGSNNWPASRARTGLVMGSVQSGKTASMLGVTALAIDQKVDIVILLGGTRISLWRQTYERFVQQLDAGQDSAHKRSRRLLCPAPGVVLSEDQSRLSDTYRMAPAAVRRKLRDTNPIIVVAMKQTDHLHALGRVLRQAIYDAVEALDRPVHMLILDDEADDGSILDAVVESGRDPAYGHLKQIPRAIANLWDPANPAPGNLYTTYIGYTATPQANLLQEDHNPLAPRNFLISLRTPLDIGHMVDPSDLTNLDAPRSSTYPEPAGSHAYYTGGEVFYRRGERAGLCIPTTPAPNEDLADAVRAFLVAGAIRLHRSGKLGPASALFSWFDTRRAAQDAVSDFHSMLFHPSSSIQEHFDAAEQVLLWAGVRTSGEARTLLESGEAFLPPALIATLDSDPANWKMWLDHYRASAAAIQNEFNLLASSSMPDWEDTKRLLADELIPGTRVAVINSDPTADDRPVYQPVRDEGTGLWAPARDLSTIFVSGNVMARGITLEGMTTALFRRASNSPVADTQMQMQRWFGYRGSYIELCRVFVDQVQLDLFRAYHDIDEAIRTAITESMRGGAPQPVVLQGRDFAATGKIANIDRVPMLQGAKPFIDTINRADQPDPNADVVAQAFGSGDSSELVVAGTVRGRIIDRPLTLGQAADLLGGLQYESYRPGDRSQQAMQWAQIESRVAAMQVLNPPGLYRPPTSGPGDTPRSACPYGIAAYLRLWEACLTRPVRGLFVTGQPGALWSMLDLKQKQAQQPRFWVGIRFGQGREINTGSLADLPFKIKATQKDSEGDRVTTTWGSNNPNAGTNQYRGDEYFDYYYRGEPLPSLTGEGAWRPVGAPGQILFYVNQRQDQSHPVVAVGVSIPAGGPEQFAATRAAII
ncbi:Z1 domain-containing protein [Flexivirga meconopsidis]|uniref:Z1 domain-containing protein n=1 Tax=Flexivirga meconopsidis TaxID=2977121 RepID=UPI00223F914E|nr:Z1 domain-containing protein [Flexivirga meconopsidis]